MKNHYLSTLLSILIPGTGQIYAGRVDRGLFILAIFILVGNLNSIWLSLHAIAKKGETNWFGNEFPLLIHDIMGFYGILFLIIQAVDAWFVTKSLDNTL